MSSEFITSVWVRRACWRKSLESGGGLVEADEHRLQGRIGRRAAHSRENQQNRQDPQKHQFFTLLRIRNPAVAGYGAQGRANAMNALISPSES
jgi:hypothetical protein